MQQHAEPVDRFQAARLGGGQQRRLQRHIDDVGDDGMRRQSGRDRARSAGWPVHAERRGVDQQTGIAEQFAGSPQADAPKRRRRNDRASSCARADVRLTTRMSPTPRAFSACMTARAAPPAPSTTARRRSPSPARARRDWRQSRARRCCRHAASPSSNHSVLTAPIASAASSRRSTSAKAASLCGMVTLPPRSRSPRSVARNCRKSRPARRRWPRSCRRCRIVPASGHGSSASGNARSDGRVTKAFFDRLSHRSLQVRAAPPATAAAAGRRW